MSKYSKLIPELIEKLGGSDNISAATHCVSRLRLVLVDEGKINTTDIEKLDHVKGVFKVNGQLHIIFGQEVEDVYDEFISFKGMSDKAIDASQVKQMGAKKQNWLKRMMTHLGEIFIPLVPILVAGGLILAFRNILETDWEGNGWTITSIPFFKGLNDFLWIPACAVFWFLPVFIVWSIFKKMKGSQVLGILIGLSLLVAMPSTYDLNSVLVEKGEPIGFDLIAKFFTEPKPNFVFSGWGQFPIKVGYTSQVIPAIAIAFFGVYVERFFKRFTTPVLRQIVVPLMTILICYVVAMLAIGPAGFVIGTTISIIISLALTNPIAKYIVAPIFGFAYGPLVITGLHHTLNAVMAQNTGTIGGSLIFPILAISNICQGSAALMVGLMNRKDEKMKQIAFPATISAWLGVTEPAMYGVNLKLSSPFFASCIGSAVGALIATIAGVTSAGIGNGAWLGVLNIQAESPIAGINTWPGTGYTWFIVASVAAMLTTMFFTFGFSKIFKKRKNVQENTIIENESNIELEPIIIQKNESTSAIVNSNMTNLDNNKYQTTKTWISQKPELTTITSVGTGKVESLDTVDDPTFKNKIIGDGIVIDCEDGKVYSPISGTISVVAPTKHAFAITSDDGISILIHIGVDTMTLEGKTFDPKVVQGQIVKQGQLLCEFDRKKIIKKGLDHRVMVLVTNDSTRHIRNINLVNNINQDNWIFKL